MKYPTGIKKQYVNHISYNNRGMSLEEDLNATNDYYLVNNIAVIYKKPTPVTIVTVDYPSRDKAVIKEAYFKTPSTTDYNGIYKGKYIDFEAKETRQNYFPINNIHKHQIDHLKKIIEMDGIGFIIIKFTKFNKTFILEADKLISYIDGCKTKSIPLSFFDDSGYIVDIKYNPRIDYIKIIDRLYFKGE